MIIQMLVSLGTELSTSMMPIEAQKLMQSASVYTVSVLEKGMSEVKVDDPPDPNEVRKVFDGMCAVAAVNLLDHLNDIGYTQVCGTVGWKSITDFQIHLNLKEGYIKPSMSVH